MKDLLESNKKIIINTDIDGVLSGLVLNNYLGCEIVGFSNSDNTVWIDESKVKTIYDAVYIDMFVPNKNVLCIDQHIIAVNENHHRILKTNKNKINPNLDNPRFHLPNKSYYLKYPFGTIHYIIASLEEQGVKIDLNLYKQVNSLKFSDLVLRADDAMKTTVDSSYIANAKAWWTWLQRKSGMASSISGMIQYLETLNSSKVEAIKKSTTQLLTSPLTFGCTSPDGGYKQIIATDGKIQPKVIKYFNFISNSAGLDCFETNLKLTSCVGRVNRVMLNTQQQINDLINNIQINGQDVFSYAFVRSSTRPANLSYTIM